MHANNTFCQSDIDREGVPTLPPVKFRLQSLLQDPNTPFSTVCSYRTKWVSNSVCHSTLWN